MREYFLDKFVDTNVIGNCTKTYLLNKHSNGDRGDEPTKEITGIEKTDKGKRSDTSGLILTTMMIVTDAKLCSMNYFRKNCTNDRTLFQHCAAVNHRQCSADAMLMYQIIVFISNTCMGSVNIVVFLQVSIFTCRKLKIHHISAVLQY